MAAQFKSQQVHENNPSVIVGLACRVPGSQNPSALWENILQQKDLRRKIPEDRFMVDNFYHPDGAHKGTTNARYGYFLDQSLRDFDATFFGISGKEAAAMDPQQRLLLEVVYEALEDAGITLNEISGTSTSVFCGSFTNDYNSMLTKDLESYPKYMVTGTGNAVLSNRVSYFYNLHGTSITIDTACSSSLVAFHLANQSLLDGESDVAIVTGSALHFDPNIFVTMTALGMLSSNGRCRTYDASGSGYVRGEGVGAIILKRQCAARSHDDKIRAVVRAAGSNHDGRKQGITLRNSVAQEALIRSTYERAGPDPADTQYFEAHGTGTAAGDPIEARAIGAVFSAIEKPLYVGSVKSNIGHLEGASGLAGLIKTTLALENKTIPPNMHFVTPNPKIEFKNWNIQVPVQTTDWQRPVDGIRRASVDSFGYGGTNAHVVLEESLEPEPQSRVPSLPASLIANGVHDRPCLIPLTSHSKKAGELLEGTLADYVRQRGCNVADLAFSLSTRRTMNQYRSFVVASTGDGILLELDTPRPAAAWTPAGTIKPRLGFVFTGQGAQWHAMGRQLIQECPLFRQTLERCDEVLQSLPDRPTWSVLKELSKTKEESLLGQTLYSQTICTAVQLSLVELLKSWSITPSAVVGHSSGEVAAAYTAGILSLESAMIAAYYRGLYMSCAPSDDNERKVAGSMMAVGLAEGIALEELKPFAGRLTIAAVNSPSMITISSDEDAIIELKTILTEKKVFARQLQVKQAFHSHHMLPLAPAYEAALQSCKAFGARPATCRMFSSVTARLADTEEMMLGKHWATNMTSFDQKNVAILVEIGPHPALKGPCRQVAQSLKLDLPYIASLTRGVPDFEGVLTMAGQLFSLGYPVDLAATNENLSIGQDGILVKVKTGTRLSDLPSYSWNHKQYWSETRVIKEHRLRRFRHSILGHVVPGSVERHPRWRNYLRLSEMPWLSEHVVDGKMVFPGAGYVAMAVEAAMRLKPALDPDVKAIALRDIVFKAPLVVPDHDEGIEVLLEVHPVTNSAKSKSDVWYEFAVFSYDDAGRCAEHCHGSVSTKPGPPAALESKMSYLHGLSIDTLRNKTNHSVSSSVFYRRLAKIGLEYGPRFSLLSCNIESGQGLAVAPLAFDPKVVPSEAADATVIHPTLLDASFHVAFGAVEACLGRQLHEPYVPSFIRYLTLSGVFTAYDSTSERQYQVCSTTKLPSARVATSDILLQDQNGELMMEMQGLEVTSLGRELPESHGKRALFFRQRYLPCFDFLSSDPRLGTRSLGEIMEIFSHRNPNSKILHITSSVARTRKAVLNLGVYRGQRRRLRRIDCFKPGEDGDAIEAFQQLADESAGRICVHETQPGDVYDLVIVSSDHQLDLAPLLKEGGVVLYDGTTNPEPLANIKECFSTSRISAYTYRTAVNTAIVDEQLTVVRPVAPSNRAQSILEFIKDVYSGFLITITPEQALEQNKTENPGPLLVLSTLGDDTSSPEAFRFMQEFLTGVTRPLVWALEGAAMEATRPSQSLIMGLIRTARSENPDQLKVTTLDFRETSPPEAVADALSRILRAGLDEDELAERNGCIYIPKIEADDERNRKLPNGPGQEPVLQLFGERRPLSLSIGRVGLLETLHFTEDNEFVDGRLAADEIEIEVKASALNFRDIAASMGIIDDSKLGDECAGIVTAVGDAVHGFSVGDRVVAWRPGQGAHRAMVRNPASLCYKLQGDMSFVDAAALPLILTTAYYALVHVARLQPGETVLIHSAAGGVGQMAIQIAQRAGARVLVTVGSQAKRELLAREYGIQEDDMFNSRDDSFLQGVMAATGGIGVDVVLNSLAGTLLHASWSCVNSFGRFVEIGKRDIHENTRLPMEPFRKSVMFASVDLITMFEKNKTLGARIFHDSCRLVHDRQIRPPASVVELSYAEALKGFRLLQMGKHIGKIVLVPGKDDLVPVLPAKFRNTKLFEPTKSYLLVGGLGGLGRTLSQWMVRKGAKKLAFLSRSGADKPEAKATVAWLKQREVEVQVYTGDVSKSSDVEACINSVGPSLRGIFHAAMVLQDAPLEMMTSSQWLRCIQPKVNGAENLHAASLPLGTELDFFVCFSSVAAIVGSKAQANYSAANSYLDALISRRRQMGLCGTTMNVGVVHSSGVFAESVALQKTMARLGMDSISDQELLYQLEEAVSSTSNSSVKSPEGVEDHQIITGLDFLTPDVYWSTKPMMRNLYANHDFGHTEENVAIKSLLTSLLHQSDPEKMTQLLLEGFIDKIAKVLATPRDSILPSNTLSAYGLDSIVAVDFRNWFHKEFQIDIALFDILASESISSLASKAAAKVVVASARAAASTIQAVDNAAVDQNATKAEIEDAHTKAARPVRSVITKVTDVDVVPLSTYQSRVWFLHNAAEDKSVLNLPIILHIQGQPCQESLEKAISELVMRNPALRTAYFEGENFAQQCPVDGYEVEVSTRDFSSAVNPAAALKKLSAHMKTIHLNIEEGEVIALSWVKLGEEEHALVCMAHHIAMDRACLKPMVNQLVQLYDAIRAGTDLSTIPRPEFSYVDFTVWHNAYLESNNGVLESKAWWKDNLFGIPAACNLLPFAKGERPVQGDPDRAGVRVTLDTKLFSRMKRVATQVGGTPYHFILAAFRAFLYRYNQDKDLVMLVVDGTRPHPDTENIVGFFVNMCPVRCQDDCETSFDQLLMATRDRALESMAHNAVPFDTIVDLMEIRKTPAHAPLGQVSVNYQIHGPTFQVRASNFVLDSVTSDDIPSASDLSLEALEAAEHSLDLRLEYATALYGEEDMLRFHDNFLTFLSSCVKDHRQPVDEIESASRWGGQSVVDRVLQAARGQQDASAIETSEGDRITYGDLGKNASYVAAALRVAGAKPGGRIALLAHPGVEAITGMLGALLTRSGYVPLDTEFAQDRLSFMITDSGAEILLVGPGAESLASATETSSKLQTSLTIIRIEDAIGAKAADPTGSTGFPKGGLLTESNTSQMISTMEHDYTFSAEDRFLHQSSMSFDLSVVQIFSALAAGARVCIASSHTRKDPHALADFMQKQSVTVTYFTPTQYAFLMESNSEALRKCVAYRVALFNGERLPVRIAKAFYELGTPANVYNAWSPSEVTVQTTVARIEETNANSDATSLPIGYPLDNCRHYILDAKGHPLPVGMVGEIVVGGAQVGAGYLNRPEANRKGFLEDPFCSPQDRARGWTRMFRTGDRGAFRPDGQLEFHGRIAGDKQIKLRGIRVDLGEVEQRIFLEARLLNQHLVDISVVARNHDDQSAEEDRQTIVAFMVPARKLDQKEKTSFVTLLHTAIGRHLNYYMLPGGYDFLEKLPMTIGGKVDRKDLLSRRLELIQPSSSSSNGPAAAPTDLDRNVLRIFQSIVGAKRYTSMADNLFDKGGNSILLVRLRARIQRQFGVTPPLAQLFEEPSAMAVSAFIQGRLGGEKTIDWTEETKLPRDGRFMPQFDTHRVHRCDVSGILLTCSESMIGAHILAALLEAKPNARIYLLGSAVATKTSAIINTVNKYNLIDGNKLTEDNILSPIEAIEGATLFQPGFGLSKPAFRRLGRAIQCIYHTAGDISLLKTYSFLKKFNVLPILDLIRLAGAGEQLSEIHYLSTWSVPHMQSWPASRRTRVQISTAEEELTHFQPPAEDAVGYFKTRWVAESLLFQAAARGFPVTVMRTSAIAPPPSLGLNDDLAISMIRAMVDTGVFPDFGGPDDSQTPPFAVDVVPVEYVASACVALTAWPTPDREEAGPSSADARPLVYHLGNPHPLRLRDLPQIVSRVRPWADRPVVVPLETWLKTIEEGERKGGEEDAATVEVRSAVFREYLARGHVMFSLDRSRTKEVLDIVAPGLDQTCPGVDMILLGDR